MLVMMGRRLFRRGGCGRAWAGVRSENAVLSDKAENCSQKQNVFCHNDVRVMVEVGLLFTFSAEAWPTTALLRAHRPTTARSGNRARDLSRTSENQSGGSSNFLLSSHSPHFAEHFEKGEVSKKLQIRIWRLRNQPNYRCF
jgi:hypothetical protein